MRISDIFVMKLNFLSILGMHKEHKEHCTYITFFGDRLRRSELYNYTYIVL